MFRCLKWIHFHHICRLEKLFGRQLLGSNNPETIVLLSQLGQTYCCTWVIGGSIVESSRLILVLYCCQYMLLSAVLNLPRQWWCDDSGCKKFIDKLEGSYGVYYGRRCIFLFVGINNKVVFLCSSYAVYLGLRKD